MEELNISVLNNCDIKRFYEQILEMLTVSDEEFFPPLSMRSSTTQSNLMLSDKCSEGVLSYFEELKKQSFMVAYKSEELLGFVSFREDFTNGEIDEMQLPNIYISTLVVSPKARGKGLTQDMYKKLFDIYKNANIFTRTWSTNAAHIKILSRFDFEAFKVIKDDRAKGVDTVYFKRTKR